MKNSNGNLPGNPKGILNIFKNGRKINIRALLVYNNIKQIDIAKKYFLNPSELNRVIKGARKNRVVRRIIAQVLDMSVEDLWEDA